MALAPRTVQNIPECFRRLPLTVLHPCFNHPGTDEEALPSKLRIAMRFALRWK